MEKILVVAESINVEDSSGSKANVALIENLHKAGFDLMVYHYTREEIQLDGIPCFAIPENRNSVFFYLSRLERKLRKNLNIRIHKPLENLFGFSFTLFNDRDSIANSIRQLKVLHQTMCLHLVREGASGLTRLYYNYLNCIKSGSPICTILIPCIFIHLLLHG